MEKQSPLLRLWELGERLSRRPGRSHLLRFHRRAVRMLPYFAAAQIIIGF